jgi:hypothetical protein
MSRQFQVYLLPADVEALIHTLKSQLGVLLIEPFSSGPFPTPLESLLRNDPLMLKTASARVDCYIVPSTEADIKMRFIPTGAHWSVEAESEAIEFAGCEFDGNVLVRGRVYFQNDLLVGDMIVPKRREFLAWADGVFRLAKKSLRRSKAFDAYVGQHAERWRQERGRFSWFVNPETGPIYEGETIREARLRKRVEGPQGGNS